MKVKQFADYLGVARQHIYKTMQNHGMKIQKPHGVGWLTKPQMKTLEKIIGKKK